MASDRYLMRNKMHGSDRYHVVFVEQNSQAELRDDE